MSAVALKELLSLVVRYNRVSSKRVLGKDSFIRGTESARGSSLRLIMQMMMSVCLLVTLQTS